jgi:hypothetical protein
LVPVASGKPLMEIFLRAAENLWDSNKEKIKKVNFALFRGPFSLSAASNPNGDLWH